MRALAIGLGVVFVFTSSMAFAQQAAPNAAASRTMVSAADVQAMMAKAKSERKEGQALLAQSMIQLAPYNVSLESRAAVANAAVHETEAELFYVIDGSATLVTGGKLTSETRTNAANLSGKGIEGGRSREVSQGDLTIVPEGTRHWCSPIDGTVVLMSLHLPHAPQK